VYLYFGTNHYADTDIDNKKNHKKL
jgi:hypothetical protein